MKIGFKPVSLSDRVQQIYDTIRMRKVINSRDLSMLLDVANSFLARLLGFHCPEVNRIKINHSNHHCFYLYFTGDLNQEKKQIIKSRYNYELKL